MVYITLIGVKFGLFFDKREAFDMSELDYANVQLA